MTLTQTALLTRRAILTLGILSLLIILTTVGSNLYYRYQLAQIPPVEEIAENKFGTLPNINFPATTVSSSNFPYSIDTNTGELPQVPKFIKVYFIPQAGLTLLAPDRARELASKLDFNIGPQTEDPNTYTFSNEQGGKLIINILSGNFSYQKSSSSSAQPADLPDKDSLVSQFKTYLSSKIQLPPELERGRDNVVDNTVTFWPDHIDNLPIITAEYLFGLIKGKAITKDNGELGFDDVTYTFWPTDLTSSSTYQLKNPNEALDDLKNGAGFISRHNSSALVSITSVSLAYYQSQTYTPYLQPVYIFEGPSFIALVPAIKN